jgi:Ran GTPase-activating protein (RanGAP) involved in mRNA processing and transport
VGEGGRAEFFERYQTRADQLAEDPSEAQRLDSARTRYIDACEAEGLAPLPLLIARRNIRTIDLAGRRLGNRMIKVYADALVRLPNQAGVEIEQLLFSENCPSGDGCSPIVTAVDMLSELTVLDLSLNYLSPKVGKRLGKVIGTHANLLDLRLADCKITDTIAAKLFSALSSQEGVLENLDLRRNQIGGMVGGKSAAGLRKLLSWDRCALQTLELAYNMLDGAAVVELAQGLQVNKSLQSLDLSWNSVCCKGAMQLAVALTYNCSLLKLNVSHAEIAERGTMVLADALLENRGLKALVIQSNPIGQRGGRAILRVISYNLRFGWDRLVEIAGCNYTVFNSTEELFDRDAAAGEHVLDLADPYERMVAWQLVDLAWSQVRSRYALYLFLRGLTSF